MNKSDPDLLYYEMPAIGEFIPIGWMQDLVARYLVWKIERKFARLERRKAWARALHVK